MLSPSQKLLVQNILDNLTERIFFFGVAKKGVPLLRELQKGYEARVIPVKYDVDIATRSDYSIVGKEKQAHWYKDFNVNATTHSILVQEVGFDIQTHLTLLASYVPNFSIQEFTPISFVLVPKTQGNSTGITYIYLHATDKDGLQAWFASRPEGRWRMAIGTDKDIKTLYVHLDVLCSFLGLSMVGETEEAMRDSLLWIKDKIDAGALDVLVRTELPFPSGLTGYCNYIDWPEDAPPDPAFARALEHAWDTTFARILHDAQRLSD